MKRTPAVAQKLVDSALSEKEFLLQLEQELRGALNVLIGATQFLSKFPQRQAFSSAQNFAGWRDHLDLIEDSTQLFSHLVEELRNYQELRYGALSLQIQAVDLFYLLQELIRHTLPRATAQGLKLTLDYQENAPILIYTDATRLRQIIYNLLETALSLTAEGGIEIRVMSSTSQEAVQIQVTDTGAGLSPLQVERLMEWPVKNASEKLPLPSGLGFRLVRYLVAEMGGQMQIDSQRHEGTTVTISLPLHSELQEALKTLTPLSLWIVAPDLEQEMPLSLLQQLQLQGIKAEGKALENAMFDLAQCEISALPNMILVVNPLLDQNIAYFARTLRANIQYRKILLLMVLPLSHNYDYDREQALIGGYNAVVIYNRHELLLDRLATAWSQWCKRKEGLKMTQIQSNQNVLLVEDSTVNRKIITLFLSELGFQPEAVANGTDALLALKKNTYGAIIMDIELPDILGLDIIEDIRERQDAMKDVPIVVLSANPEYQYEENYERFKINTYLVKPITFGQLRQVMSQFFPHLAVANTV